MAEETEKIYVIPLKKKNYPSSIAAPTAMNRVKQYLIKHMKVNESDIWIDESLNHEVWKRGKYNMPNKLRVKAVKFDDGVVEVYLPELEFTKSRREILQDEKAKKQPILLKEEETDEEEMDTGADDYNVVPTSDGEVKIKKKKHEKETDETDEEEPEELESEEEDVESNDGTDESADIAEEEQKKKESEEPAKEKKKGSEEPAKEKKKTKSSDAPIKKKKKSSDKDTKESD